MTIVSENRSVILHIYKELILTLCHSNDRFLSGIMTEIADKSLLLTEKIDAISMKTIRQRITELLEYDSRTITVKETGLIRNGNCFGGK